MALGKLMVAGLLLAGVAVSPASAVTTISASLNSATLLPNIFNVVAISPVTLGVGDTLDLTINFTGGPAVVGNGSALWIALLTSTGPSGTVNTTSTLSVIGGSANMVTTAGPLSQANLYVHVGSYFFNSLVQTSAGNMSFTGLNQVLTLDSDDMGVARDYQNAFFYYDVAGSPTVPEPASWALMIAGFGLVGGALRARRTVTAA